MGRDMIFSVCWRVLFPTLLFRTRVLVVAIVGAPDAVSMDHGLPRPHSAFRGSNEYVLLPPAGLLKFAGRDFEGARSAAAQRGEAATKK
jgi:hypothetical protein